MFGPKREEVAGGWERLHKEEFHKLFYQILLGRPDQENKISETRSMRG